MLRETPQPIDAKKWYVLQLDGPMTRDRRIRLERAGIVLAQYLPDHAYLARFPIGDAGLPAEVDFVRWVGSYRDEWKIDPAIGLRPLQTALRTGPANQDRVRLVVTAFPGEEAPLGDLAAIGAQVMSTNATVYQWLLDVEIPRADVLRLAAVPWVQFVEEAPEGALRNDTNEWIVQSNEPGSTPVWDRGLHGERQVGGLIDSIVNASHCSFADSVPIGPAHRKIVGYRGTGAVDAHGTHTAGTFIGDWGTWGEPDARDGMALAAKLSFSHFNGVFGAPSSFYPRLSDAHADGARVHNNSWGDDQTTAYTTWCRQADEFSRVFEDSLVVFAATNLSTLRTPENAKNVLAVGATLDTPGQGSHSSGGSGPTLDGRRKPEVYAPGANTSSSAAFTSCGWAPDSGTSMAAPAVSGAGLLVRQYFEDGFYPGGAANAADAMTPTGALVKAVLINSAVDMTGVVGYPSQREGWGRVLLDGALYFAGDESRLFVHDLRNAGGLATGESRMFPIQVTDSVVPLRVTLVWTDVPAAVGANFAPVNDLDLKVSHTGGAVYLGNVFDAALGESIAGGARDTLNNVEQVHRLSPAAGVYVIEVLATEVNAELQGFALVVTGAIQAVPGDCNHNSVPDDVDIRSGASGDCNLNSQPDECEPDFDGDEAIDACDGDIDNDGVYNEADVCDFTPVGAAADPSGVAVGDRDADCDIDLSDYRFFDDCIEGGGPGATPQTPGCLPAYDGDLDGDIDLEDFARFSRVYSGPGL